MIALQRQFSVLLVALLLAVGMVSAVTAVQNVQNDTPAAEAASCWPNYGGTYKSMTDTAMTTYASITCSGGAYVNICIYQAYAGAQACGYYYVSGTRTISATCWGWQDFSAMHYYWGVVYDRYWNVIADIQSGNGYMRCS